MSEEKEEQKAEELETEVQAEEVEEEEELQIMTVTIKVKSNVSARDLKFRFEDAAEEATEVAEIISVDVEVEE